jgi:hypothetical protein
MVCPPALRSVATDKKISKAGLQFATQAIEDLNFQLAEPPPVNFVDIPRKRGICAQSLCFTSPPH